jgi:acylphosphatase
MSKGRVHLKIHGKVQGVFFRATAKEKAQELELVGWVRNNPEGSVEIIAEGDREDLESYIAWCNSGPRNSRVDNVSVEWGNYEEEFENFKIEYI